MARTTFKKQKTKATDVLVVLSDGESFENDPIESARVAAEQGLVIYTVGIGTPTGEPIPDYDALGNPNGFKKDKSGQVVVSRLNEAMLRQIAEVTKGKYFFSSNFKFVMDDIYKEVSRLEKNAMEEQLKRSFIDRYRWFLFPAFLILLIEFLISERRRAMPEWKGRL
jgi:Ca-activated chloride channel homolog